MSTPTPPPSRLAAEKEPFVYSQNPQAVKTRLRRTANKEAKAALPGLLECRNSDSVTSNSDASSGTIRKKRKRPEDYAQTPNAIAQRARHDNMAPEVRKKMLKRQTDYYAITHAPKSTESEEGDAEQQRLSVDDEGRVIQEQYVVVITIPSLPSNALIVTLKTPLKYRLLGG